ncbi:iron chelate uptake ABC transporter family permease subunit [Streptomyces sp. NPDC047072]|uniref:iron chelate uptake ABC transporter family permease subunit n=1 Tax=Streptomyces sp. NPDC047072 TaxID=3154809 RepID=UPI0034113342
MPERSGKRRADIRVRQCVARRLSAVLPAPAWPLTALQLDDDSARELGTRVKAVRPTLVPGAVGLTALATTSTGPIAFLSAPLTHRRTGANASPVLPAGLTDPVLVLTAGLIGQVAFNTRFAGAVPS